MQGFQLVLFPHLNFPRIYRKCSAPFAALKKKKEFKWFLNVFKKQVTTPFALLNLSPSLSLLSPDCTRHNDAKCLAVSPPPRKRLSEGQRKPCVTVIKHCWSHERQKHFTPTECGLHAQTIRTSGSGPWLQKASSEETKDFKSFFFQTSINTPHDLKIQLANVGPHEI